ncbi:MAG TPA: FecR domain-containing protein [Planctomycetota bacterium]|nr:FecR domain-containing protein [Planctomycetota bacterium]
MQCEACTELLADFLLDELPESQAVLVQEHLNLCPACMQTYKELKGTGKALEAVPVMRSAKPSPQFGQAVRAQAAVELAQIVEKLPPEKRVRLEARRAARRGQPRPAPARKPSWATPLILVAAVVGVALSALIVVSRQDPAAMMRGPLGKLTLSNGKADYYVERQNMPHTPAQQGRDILPGDAFLTADNGCARFELTDGSNVYLGPHSGVIFKATGGRRTIELETGQLGVQCPPAVRDAVEVQCGTFRIAIDRDSHVYLSFQKQNRDAAGTISVLRGTVRVTRPSGDLIALAASGTRVRLDGAKEPVAESLQDAIAPAWRADLTSEADLQRFLTAPSKILSRGPEGVEVSLTYGRSAPRPASGAAAGQEDWNGENNDSIVQRGDGSIGLPQGSKLRHAVPFAAPLSFELALNADSPRDVPFAFGAVESPQSSVAVDVAEKATMQVNEADRPARSESVPARKAGSAERLRLEIIRESGGLTAVMTSASGKSKILPLQRARASGDLWMQALGNGIVLDEIKLQAVIPIEWLLQQLSR